MISRILVFSFAVLFFSCSLAIAEHECKRECKENDAKTCYYEFREQEYSTMGRACFDCETNSTDCSRPDCVPGDGVGVPFMTINRQLPGPAIQVCKGDEIIVDLVNSLLSDTETLHWHGLHMRTSQHMDGVPFITQCPITGKFRYQFTVDQSGTYFWHSHTGVHRLAGIQGALVIRQPDDILADTYDYDDPAHVFLLHDWVHVSAETKLTSRLHYKTDDFPSSLLINGRGLNTMAKTEGVAVVDIDRHVVEVEPGKRYRLRFINGAGMNCPMMISVDSHNFTVISSDGQPVEPTDPVSSLILFMGERFDIVIEASQMVDNYWIRVNGLIDCEPNECIQGIVLRYTGAPESNPAQELVYSLDPPPGIHVNPLNSGPGKGLLTMTDLNGIDLDPFEDPCLLPNVDKQFYLAFDFATVNNTLLYDPDYYPYNLVSEEFHINTPQINGLTFKFPSTPPLINGIKDIEEEYCRYGTDPPCVSDFCTCSYLLEVGLGETVEIILVDGGHIGDENHPFHLHGNSFYVVAMDRLGSEVTVQEVQDLDAAGGIKRKLTNPVLKDDVTIPDGGYTIIRFTADNPGYWIMHCHIMFHSEVGMAALLKVGGDEDIPIVPTGFPTCSNYVPNNI